MRVDWQLIQALLGTGFMVVLSCGLVLVGYWPVAVIVFGFLLTIISEPDRTRGGYERRQRRF
jgi:hypothetical protein